MDTIKNYLETMFSKLPNTQEVARAKEELLQMMEDKYSELTSEGKTENEAVGTVISEFGNLDELAEELGIKSFVGEGDEVKVNARRISLEEVEKYLEDRLKQSICVGFGVMLCILAPALVAFLGNFNSSKTQAIGIGFFFGMIAVGVVLFVASGTAMKKWKFLKETPCSVDFEITNFVNEGIESFRVLNIVMIAIGILLCVICFVPVVVLDEYSYFGNSKFEAIGILVMFIMIAIGVFLIITANMRQNSYELFLNIGDDGTLILEKNKRKETKYKHATVANVMSVYWLTITAIYLCYSFLTFNWHFSWIIWIIAALVESAVKILDKQIS